MRRLDRLHLEVTNVCNFKCEFCPDAVMERSRGHMDFNRLQTILREVAAADLAEIVAFHLMGEPLIYPHIFPAIATALSHNLRLHLTTNGSTFALKPEHIPQLIASGIPKVTISLQTPDPETFQIRGAPPRLLPDAYFAGITAYVQANLAAVESPTRVHLKFLDTSPHPFLVPHKPLRVVNGVEHMQAELTAWSDRLLADCPVPIDPGHIQTQIQQFKPGRWQLIWLHPKLALECFPLDLSLIHI